MNDEALRHHAARAGIETKWRDVTGQTRHVPSDLLRAYTQVELEALAAQNPSGLPSGRQKRQARLTAKERLEDESRDGRYLRRKSFPLLWDAPSGELLVGTTSVTALDRLVTLFHQTFERSFDALRAGRQAFQLAEADDKARQIDDATGARAIVDRLRALFPAVHNAADGFMHLSANHRLLSEESTHDRLETPTSQQIVFRPAPAGSLLLRLPQGRHL